MRWAESIDARSSAPAGPGAQPETLAEVLARLEDYLRTDDARAEDALARLEASPTVRQWMSPIFLSSYVSVKRKEIAMMDGKTPEEICARYRDAY